MNNSKNLIPLNKRTKNEQRSIAQSGGIASGISRREKRQMKEILLYLLNCNTPEGISTKEAIGVALIKECLNGNIRAFETLMLMIGEQPQESYSNRPVISMESVVIDGKKLLLDIGEEVIRDEKIDSQLSK